MNRIRNIIEKISVVDIIVVFALIIVLIAAYDRFKGVAENSAISDTAGINFEYTVKFQNVRPTSGEMLKVGDVVYDKVSGTQIGKISSISVSPTVLQLETMSGQIINDEFEERIDILLTVETTGSIKNGEYMASNLIRILLGKNLEIVTKYIDISGVIIDIKKIEV